MRTQKIRTPFGDKYFVNADMTASGVPEENIDLFMKTNIEPFYTNTHSNNHNGKMMAHYIEESKNIIRKSVNASEDDQVIFTGNGCTGAVRHLIHAFGLHNTTKKISIFISVLEHHSNCLPWKHLPHEMVVIPVNGETGMIDLDILEEELINKSDTIQVCSFTGCSNVTGVLQPVFEIAKLVHKYYGLVFFDFAACAPYIPINMHKEDNTYFDAIYVSPHKFVGGVGTPGILIANKKLFINEEPFYPGGGTINFDCNYKTKYCENIETRETGGTPNILGSIRAGLAFDLKNKKLQYITRRNREINKMVHEALENIDDVQLLNPPSRFSIDQIPIYSFTIKPYHYNLIVVLFNDLFGIQVRGGVSCCSLYACSRKQDGWVRITFHYSMSNNVVRYILSAVRYIAKHIYILKRSYRCDENGGWTHTSARTMYPKLQYPDNSQITTMHVNKLTLTKAILQKQLEDV